MDGSQQQVSISEERLPLDIREPLEPCASADKKIVKCNLNDKEVRRQLGLMHRA